jgi:hypothetical protein
MCEEDFTLSCHTNHEDAFLTRLVSLRGGKSTSRLEERTCFSLVFQSWANLFVKGVALEGGALILLSAFCLFRKPRRYVCEGGCFLSGWQTHLSFREGSGGRSCLFDVSPTLNICFERPSVPRTGQGFTKWTCFSSKSHYSKTES